MLVSITAPATNHRGPQYMEKVFASIRDSIGSGDHLHLIYGTHNDAVGIFCRFDDHLQGHVLEHLTAKYGNCSIERMDDNGLDPPSGSRTFSVAVTLCPELFPIIRHKQFTDLIEGNLEDPLESLLGVIQPGGELIPRIEITIRPASRRRRRRARFAVKRLDRSFFRRRWRLADLYARSITRPWLGVLLLPLGLLATHDRFARDQTDATGGRYGEREADLQAAADKIGGSLFEARVRLLVSAPAGAEAQARRKLRTMRGAFGAFTKSRLATFHSGRSWFLCSHEELATLFHPPTRTLDIERKAVSPFRELEPPAMLAVDAEEGSVVIGAIKYRSDARTASIAKLDRRRHLYIVGKTGMGKTSLLRSQIEADIVAGRGICVIDPHGDLALDTLRSIPSHRTNDVIVFDPSDPEYALGFNPLECMDPERRDLVADDVHSAIDNIFDFSRSPRMSDTLRNALYVLIEKKGTLLDLLRFFSDPAFHHQMIVGIEDPLARTFWQLEFPSWNKQDRNLTVAAIQNKTRPFLMNTKVRAIVSQSGAKTLKLRQVMDEGHVLIVNLSKGQLGEGNANLLGALLVTSIQQAALSRADIPEQDRRDFYCFVDEFQNFAVSGSFESILSEARKYRLNLTVAHQYLTQLSDAIADAVFGNVGSMVCFQVGPDDARTLARQLSKFEGQVLPEDLANLPKYHAYVRLLQDGMPSRPFSIETIEPRAPTEDRSAIVRRVSNMRGARRREDVLAGIQPSSALSPVAPEIEAAYA